jgi:hypothetical protein
MLNLTLMKKFFVSPAPEIYSMNETHVTNCVRSTRKGASFFEFLTAFPVKTT